MYLNQPTLAFSLLFLPLLSTARTFSSNRYRHTSGFHQPPSQPSQPDIPRFSSEYYSLGCPQNTTFPYATQKQQLEVLIRYAQLLYVEQDVAQAYHTYAATNFINHAPEVPGDGTAIAIATQTAMLKGGSVQIQRQFTGYNLSGAAFRVTYFKGISPVEGVGVIADIWRMQGTCLLEHWDVAEGASLNTTMNPHPYF
ncbi:hypothetical protein MMC34_001225 [Xylographa carneopallida]|nr:hypothetical protein [Xylographa carneopallida]